MSKPVIVVTLIGLLSIARTAWAQFPPPQLPAFTDTTNTQPPSPRQMRLLYHVISEHDYYMPEIEQMLKRLRFTNSNRPIYSKVISLNILTENTISESDVADYQYHLSGEFMKADPERQKANKKLACSLLGYDRLLQIKIDVIPVSGIISLQFRMFNVTNNNGTCGGTDVAKLPKPDLQTYETSSFTFDPRDNANVRIPLLSNLKKVNRESNSVPEITTFVNGTLTDSLAEVPISKRIEVEARVDDMDSEPDDMLYEWQQFKRKPDDQIIPIKQDIPLQSFSLGKTGDYFLNVNAYDGINYSKDKALHLRAIKPPNISYIQHDVESFDYLFNNDLHALPTVAIYYRKFPAGKMGKTQNIYDYNEVTIGVDTLIDSLNHHLQFDFRNDEHDKSYSLFTSRQSKKNTKDKLEREHNRVEGKRNSMVSDEEAFSHMTIRYGYEDKNDFWAEIRPHYDYLPAGDYVIKATASYKGIKGTSRYFKVDLRELSKTSFFVAICAVSFASVKPGFSAVTEKSSQVQAKVELGLTHRFNSILEMTGTLSHLYPYDGEVRGNYRISNSAIHSNLGLGTTLAFTGKLQHGIYTKWYLLRIKGQPEEMYSYTTMHELGAGYFLRFLRFFQLNVDAYPKISDKGQFNRFNILEFVFAANFSHVKK